MKNGKFLRTTMLLMLSLVIIGSVIGGTIAWFTDEVTSTNNIIKTGNLDLIVEYTKDINGEWAELKEDTKLFDENALYEPGYTETVFLRLANKGNLALKYNLAVSVVDTKIGKSALGNEIALSEHMEMGIYIQDEYVSGDNFWDRLKGSMFNTRENTLSNVTMTALDTKDEEGRIVLATDHPLLVESDTEKTSQVVALVLHMPTTVGNEANHNGTDVPEMQIGLHAVATQFTHEEDSFNNQYDADATYPYVEVVDPNMPKATMRELGKDELSITCTDDYQGAAGINTFLDGEQTLDFGVVFSTTETAEDLANVDYSKWVVDFELESTKALSKDDSESHIALAGYYYLPGFVENDIWLGFDVVGIDVPANEPQRVMAVYDDNITYKQVVESVGEFKCGVIVDKNYFDGETLTLKLCMYEPDGTRHVIKTVEKTF